MITVGLFKRDDSKADALVNEIAKAFADAGISTTAAPGLHITASACKQCNGTRRVLACCEYHAHWQDRLARCERCSADVPFPTLIVSVGGDGTFLRALSSLGKFLPVVGLNGGTLGFLTRYTQADIGQLVADVRAGDLPVQRRMVLACEVRRRDGNVLRFSAVNDVIVKAGASHRLLTLSTKIGGGPPAARFKADGVIVSTPLGSTAYSLSAGGPIIDASAPVVVVTPLLAPSPTLRPIITGTTSPITIELGHHLDQACVLVDGAPVSNLSYDDRVTITVSPDTRLMVPPRAGVYEVLRSKLGFNGGEA